MNKKLELLVLIIAFVLMGCSGGTNTKKDHERDSEIDQKQASMTNVQLGIGYFKRGNYEVSQDKLLRAIEQDPNNIVAYTTMAFLLMQINKMEEAEKYYLDALDIKSNDPGLRNGYGTYLCRVGRIDDAMEQFKEAYGNPFYKTPYLAYSNAGTCLLQVEKYGLAEKLLRKALVMQPELSGALISMAELSIKTKKYMMARAYVQRYHAVNKPSAESLWLQVQAERALGATEHYLKYARQLLDEFPDSEQAGLVGELGRRDRIKQN
ncbi:MAG: type IV pilus biogenesis/stability protein PilW [Gammaproteobacteria bacterium]|nr:type IV pilus biogenesis/stability protein PilW [Gammaproteobacteria bacterium]MCW8922789.1 type IV pilus biogenesis/stability protein PilW [Gammaproteobacteria bacterium]